MYYKSMNYYYVDNKNHERVYVAVHFLYKVENRNNNSDETRKN